MHLVLSASETHHPRIAHLGDNTSVVAWLNKTSFNVKSQPEYNELSRSLGRLFMDQDGIVVNTHLTGKLNFVSGSLSRDTHLDQTTHMQLLYSLDLSQLPTSLNFQDLTKEIISDLSSYARLLPNKQASPVVVT